MSDLYDVDLVEWSERQAQLLRRIADGEPANELPDWDNIIEELEDLGRSEVSAVESLLLQALLHDLKVRLWPYAQHVPNWEGEARLFRRQARRKLSSSMVHRIDVTSLFVNAMASLPQTIDGYPPAEAPLIAAHLSCPATLMEALADTSLPPRAG